MDSNRQAEFKKGISGKTEKRHEQQISLRKNKREDKLFERRRRVHEDPMNDASQFQTLLNQFNPKGLENGDLHTLEQLKNLICMADEYQIEHYIMKHIFPYVPLLVKFCETAGCVEYALTCLVNLTATQMDHDQKLAGAIFKAGFIARTAPGMLALHHQGTCLLSLKVRSLLWDLITNLVLTCKEARNDVMKSPLINNGDAQSPFFQELFLLYDEQRTDEPTRLALIQQLIYTIAALLQGKFPLPPHMFCHGIWPFLQRIITTERLPDSITSYLYNSLYLVIEYQYIRDADNRTHELPRMLLASDTKAMLFRMKDAFKATQSLQIKFFIVQIITNLSSVPIGEGALQTWFDQTHWTTLMIQCSDHTNPDIRELSFLFMGNYMADGVPFVRRLMDLGVIRTIVNKLQKERFDAVRYNALYAFLLMFKACDADRKIPAMKEMAEALMQTLVVEHSIFNYILPYITRHGASPDMIRYSLEALQVALLWNSELIKKEINNRGEEALDDLLNQLNHNKGARDTRIFDLACQVDDLLNDKMEMDNDQHYFSSFNF